MSTYRAGQLVEISDGRVGTIRFAGNTKFAPGDWIGIEFDEATGKNDGSVQGERYFDCEDKHGMFLKPTAVVKVLEEPTKSAAAPASAAKAKQPAAASSTTKPGLAKPRQSTVGVHKPSASLASNSLNGGLKKPGPTNDPASARRQTLNSQSPTPVRTSTTATSRLSKPGAPAATTASRTSTTTAARGATTTRPSTTSRTSISSSTARPAAAPATATSRLTRPTSISAGRGTTATARGSATTAGTRTSTGQPLKPARPSTVNSNPRVNGVGKPTAKQQIKDEGQEQEDQQEDDREQTNGIDHAHEQDESEGEEEARTKTEDDAKQHNADEDQDEQEQLNGHKTSDDESAENEKVESTPKPPAPTPKPSANRTKPAPTNKPAPRVSSTSAAPATQALQKQIQILEQRRAEDKDELKTLGREKAEKERLEGILQKVQNKCQSQQQELVALRKQFKDAEGKLEEFEGRQTEYDDQMENATLDREMAEEKLESITADFEALRLKADEAQLELEVLRGENEELGREMSPEERTSQGWLQLERSNARYREALIRLRELTEDNEADLKDQIKSLQEDLDKLSGVDKQYEDVQRRLQESESTIEDLRQRLDAALGSEDMVEELSQKNMDMNDRIEELKTNIQDLEDLKEIADELESNHLDTEKQLEAELEYMDATLKDAGQRIIRQDKRIQESDELIGKYQEVVRGLQEDLKDTQASQQLTEGEAKELTSRSKAMADLNTKLQNSAAKSRVNLVDLESQRLEAQEAIEHLAIIQLFLPEEFRSERHSVLAYLRFRRIAAKARLLRGSLKDYIGSDGPRDEHVNVYVICDILDKLTWIAAMCDRFVGDIRTADLKHFARYDSSLDELQPLEDRLKRYFEAFKRQELNERQAADELQRSTALLSHLEELHMRNDNLQAYADDIVMRTTLMQSYLENTATALSITKQRVSAHIEADNENLEDSLTIFSRDADNLIFKSRSARVIAGKALSSLTDLKGRFMSLDRDTSDAFDQSVTATRELEALAKNLGERVTSGLESTLTDEQPDFRSALREALKATCVEVLHDSSTSSPIPEFSTKLNHATSLLSNLNSLSMNINATHEFTQVPPPWELRAEALKNSGVTAAETAGEIKRLRNDLQDRAAQLRQRDETLEEQQLKIETLESRTKDVKAKAERINELIKTVDAAKQKERDLNVKIAEHLDKSDNMQRERDHWKQIADQRGLEADAVSDGRRGSKSAQAGERAVGTHREMEALRKEISSLQGAVRHLREDNRRVRLADPKEAHMAWLREPLRPTKTEERKSMEAWVGEGRDVFLRLLDMCTEEVTVNFKLKLPSDKLAWRPIRQKAGWRAARGRENFEAWKGWDNDVLARGRELGKAQGTTIEQTERLPDGRPRENGEAKRPPAFDSGVSGLDADVDEIKDEFADARSEVGVSPTVAEKPA